MTPLKYAWWLNKMAAAGRTKMRHTLRRQQQMLCGRIAARLCQHLRLPVAAPFQVTLSLSHSPFVSTAKATNTFLALCVHMCVRVLSELRFSLTFWLVSDIWNAKCLPQKLHSFAWLTRRFPDMQRHECAIERGIKPLAFVVSRNVDICSFQLLKSVQCSLSNNLLYYFMSV